MFSTLDCVWGGVEKSMLLAIYAQPKYGFQGHTSPNYCNSSPVYSWALGRQQSGTSKKTPQLHQGSRNPRLNIQSVQVAKMETFFVKRILRWWNWFQDYLELLLLLLIPRRMQLKDREVIVGTRDEFGLFYTWQKRRKCIVTNEQIN